MSLAISAELAAACNALGRYDKESKTYFNEDNILETVKDIIRYLRRDTDNHEIRRYFGAANILEINLIPLFKNFWKQTELFDVLLRLLGNLTSPVLLLYHEEVPTEKTARNHFLEILSHLQSYKEAFADEEIWVILSTRLTHLLKIDWQERGEENGLIIERILILVRNVLHIPANTDIEKRADNDLTAHDKVIWTLRQSGILDIIHYMVSCDQEECYYMYLLELLSLMLREHRTIDLANASSAKTEVEKRQESKEFDVIRSRELSRRRDRVRAYTSARHSRFGGTYTFENMNSVTDNQQLVYHRKLSTADNIDFDADKRTMKVAKNRKNIYEVDTYRRSTYSMRLLLKDVCIEFLNSGYNRLMHDIRGKLIRGKLLTSDETYYLWALRYFMEFNRQHKFDLKLVSETMAVPIFHYIQQLMEHNFDMMQTDKKKWPLWSKRLHVALQAYKELYLNLIIMDKSTDSSVRDTSKIIKSNVFYVVEYREFLLQLLAAYNPRTMSNLHLFDLMETQHIFLKLLQEFCGRDNSIIVQKRQKIQAKRKPTSTPVISVEESLEIKWDELASQLTTVLEGGENIPVLAPFDAASEVPINEQRKDAMIKIQNYLRENEIENAIGLLRSARDVWPDNDSFGSSNMTPEEEFLAIREIFFAKLRDSEELSIAPEKIDDADEENEEDEFSEDTEIEKEVNFKFQDFVARLAQPKVIQACGLALKTFDTNSVYLNHCVLKLLHRIAWDCRMSAMIFQASIFRTFQRIFREANRPEFKELVKFAIFIVREFIKVSEKNKKVFMELLFWKNCKDAYDIEEGYGSYVNKAIARKAVWTEEQENELRVLVMEHKEKDIQEDAVDWIINNLVDNTKSRRMVIKKLKEMMLLDYKGPNKKNSSFRPSKEWNEAEINQLTELYNQFKEASDPLSCIVDRLEIKRPKARVKQKIIELGLVSDSKALRKKRTSKRQQIQEFSSTDFIANRDSSSDEENEDNNKSVSKTAPSKRNSARKNSSYKILELSAIKEILVTVIYNDMTEPLKWISECLAEAAEDQEQDINIDGNEGIPIVPICESDMKAMKNRIFQKALLSIGIQEPASEQEMYWRIPGNISASDLTKLSNLINEVIQNPEPSRPENDSSDEDIFDRIQKYMSKSNDVSPNSSKSATEFNRPSSSNRSKINDFEDTENIDRDSEDNEKEFENRAISSKKTKRIQVINDSDESDTENINNINSNNEYSIQVEELPSSSNRSKINDFEETEHIDRYSEDNEKEFENRVISSKKTKRIQVINDSDESDTENINNINSNNGDYMQVEELPSSSNRSKINDFEDTENIDRDSEDNEKEFENRAISSKKTKRIQVINDSDESDTENINNINSNNGDSIQVEELESEEEELAGKRSRNDDSDSDRMIKRKKFVILDSDEEN